MKISTVTATHNRAYLFSRAIMSIANQTHKPDEWIIVDDSSVDNTEEFVSRLLKDMPNVMYYKMDERSGVAKAKNRGIELANPDNYIHIFDDDDVLFPNFYERMLQSIEGYDTVFCPFYIVKEVLQPNGVLVDVGRNVMEDWKGFVPGKQKERPYISMVCSLFRPEFFKDYGPFDESMKFCIEWPVLLRAELQGAKFNFLDELLGEIRWRVGGLVDNVGFTKNPVLMEELKSKIDAVISKYGGGA